MKKVCFCFMMCFPSADQIAPIVLDQTQVAVPVRSKESLYRFKCDNIGQSRTVGGVAVLPGDHESMASSRRSSTLVVNKPLKEYVFPRAGKKKKGDTEGNQTKE